MLSRSLSARHNSLLASVNSKKVKCNNFCFVPEAGIKIFLEDFNI